MKKFVAIYLGSAEGLAEWKATDDEKRKEREKAGMEGWMKWAKDNEASIVALGSPLGKTKRIDAVFRTPGTRSRHIRLSRPNRTKLPQNYSQIIRIL
jgi:hypothetical protein